MIKQDVLTTTMEMNKIVKATAANRKTDVQQLNFRDSARTRKRQDPAGFKSNFGRAAEKSSGADLAFPFGKTDDNLQRDFGYSTRNANATHQEKGIRTHLYLMFEVGAHPRRCPPTESWIFNPNTFGFVPKRVCRISDV